MTCAESEKQFKRAEHQRERAHVRQTLQVTTDDTAIAGGKAYGDPWKGDKDGKHYLGDVQATAGFLASLKPHDGKRQARELHKLFGK